MHIRLVPTAIHLTRKAPVVQFFGLLKSSIRIYIPVSTELLSVLPAAAHRGYRLVAEERRQVFERGAFQPRSKASSPKFFSSANPMDRLLGMDATFHPTSSTSEEVCWVQ
jgi:hypothetical protein